ncbi:hypothetical protein [Heliomarina baculiformis]|uniref:hypothetical protein n=1 Tax=Heliomarina baculiformis TaxID=2872036 RepID=UPI001EE370FC|nr:hypothetical protein [Heliomarina baculiformis]
MWRNLGKFIQWGAVCPVVGLRDGGAATGDCRKSGPAEGAEHTGAGRLMGCYEMQKRAAEATRFRIFSQSAQILTK